MLPARNMAALAFVLRNDHENIILSGLTIKQAITSVIGAELLATRFGSEQIKYFGDGELIVQSDSLLTIKELE